MTLRRASGRLSSAGLGGILPQMAGGVQAHGSPARLGEAVPDHDHHLVVRIEIAGVEGVLLQFHLAAEQAQSQVWRGSSSVR